MLKRPAPRKVGAAPGTLVLDGPRRLRDLRALGEDEVMSLSLAQRARELKRTEARGRRQEVTFPSRRKALDLETREAHMA